MRKPSILPLLGACLAVVSSSGRAADNPKVVPAVPSLTVTGQAGVSAQPDQAIITLGTIHEATEASVAQQQVNKVMQAGLQAIKVLGIAEDHIRTAGLSLSPVYNNPRPNNQPSEPRITGYRASNTIEVKLDDLTLVGKVIDVSVAAGANQLQNLSFQLKDDTRQKREALRMAVSEARAKAEAIAGALNARLGEAIEVEEGGARIVRPQMELARASYAMSEMATPIQAGQVRVEATVNIRFRISQER